MRLEDAIQQRYFKHEWIKATLNIIYTHNWITAQIKHFLKDYDITPQQYNVLRILRGHAPNPMTTFAIRERMLDRMSDASRIVDRLSQKKLVENTICPHDKRLADVRITNKGLELLRQINAKEEQIDRITDRLSEAEARELNRLLDKIRTKPQIISSEKNACATPPA